MLKQMLFEATRIPLLAKGLDAYALRHRVISDNVVNTETPGYRRKQVEFEEELQATRKRYGLRRTDPLHLGRGGMNPEKVTPEVTFDQRPSDVNDLNNVDIDREMTDMARNQLQFNFASQLSRLYFELLKTSIRGY